MVRAVVMMMKMQVTAAAMIVMMIMIMTMMLLTLIPVILITIIIMVFMAITRNRYEIFHIEEHDFSNDDDDAIEAWKWKRYKSDGSDDAYCCYHGWY
ncbi:hypothetical protein ElyMa_000572000 [Elysia marginata]|uniref:Uncharacterized protein n=1 Tax=Elysia marginata TaxID=1093978 RepID=A0AAV4G3Z0_9GAST|nr:hypothetical protein ElyMa_000572000 [Elysia marginata]